MTVEPFEPGTKVRLSDAGISASSAPPRWYARPKNLVGTVLGTGQRGTMRQYNRVQWDGSRREDMLHPMYLAIVEQANQST